MSGRKRTTTRQKIVSFFQASTEITRWAVKGPSQDEWQHIDNAARLIHADLIVHPPSTSNEIFHRINDDLSNRSLGDLGLRYSESHYGVQHTLDPTHDNGRLLFYVDKRDKDGLVVPILQPQAQGNR